VKPRVTDAIESCPVEEAKLGDKSIKECPAKNARERKRSEIRRGYSTGLLL